MSPIVFSYDHLVNYTNNFHEDNRLGGGGFADVFKGFIPGNNIYGLPESIVAIKRAKTTIDEAQFLAEKIWLIRFAKTPNIINLIGYNDEPHQQKCLVIEYAPNGTLTDCIKGNKLNWNTIKDIIIKLGEAIFKIHNMDTRESFLHGDFKTDNILVTENLEPMISDFGTFGKVDHSGGDKEKRKAPVYTTGYYDPERFIRRMMDEGDLRRQSDDVYSFGVTILQLIMKFEKPTIESNNEILHIQEYACAKFAKENNILDDSLWEPSCKKEEVQIISQLALDLTRSSRAETSEADLQDLLAKFGKLSTDSTDNVHIGGASSYIERPTIRDVRNVLRDLSKCVPYEQLTDIRQMIKSMICLRSR